MKNTDRSKKKLLMELLICTDVISSGLEALPLLHAIQQGMNACLG